MVFFPFIFILLYVVLPLIDAIGQLHILSQLDQGLLIQIAVDLVALLNGIAIERVNVEYLSLDGHGYFAAKLLNLIQFPGVLRRKLRVRLIPNGIIIAD